MKIKVKNIIKKLKKGDKVFVSSGKDKNQQGEVIKIFTASNKALVSGVNMVKKHIKAQGKDKPGGIIEKESPLYISKLMVVCPVCKKATRVGFQTDTQGKKKRVCKKCKGLIDGGK
jgi:large subunit ribosomal protein L24